jgi:hypothetical protein
MFARIRRTLSKGSYKPLERVSPLRYTFFTKIAKRSKTGYKRNLSEPRWVGLLDFPDCRLNKSGVGVKNLGDVEKSLEIGTETLKRRLQNENNVFENHTHSDILYRLGIHLCGFCRTNVE